MNIKNIFPKGYCHGVINAINIVKKAINDPATPRPIYILGSIIHNKHIVNALNEYGCITLDGDSSRLDLIEKISEGSVVFTAHGVSPMVVSRAIEKGLNVINASCKDVLSVHNKIKSYLDLKYQIIYIGQTNHPETEGVLGINDSIINIYRKEDVKNICFAKDVFVTNQTTQSLDDISPIHKEILKCIPNAVIDNDICNATTLRQNALSDLSSDFVIVVGDKKSSNSNKLVSIAEKQNIPTKLIESIEDIDPLWFKDINSVAITAGASTPPFLTSQIVTFLEQFDYNDKKTWKNFQIIKDIELL